MTRIYGTRQSRWFNAVNAPLAGLVSVYFMLAGFYSLTTPLFEAPDEYYHFAFIEHYARAGRPPPADNPDLHPWRQIVFHAPLYYYLSSFLVRPIDTDDFLTRYPLNPHAQIGEPSARHNHNFIAHSGDPWTKTGLAARLVRLFSLVMGAATLVFVFVLVRRVFPARPRAALLGVLALILNPQFLFISGVITNDVPAIMLTTCGLVLLAELIRRGITAPRVIMLALIAACAALAKSSGLVLLPVALAGIAVVGWRDRLPRSRLIVYLGLAALVWLAVAGWWYVENWRLYGDPTAARMVAWATGLRAGDVDYIGELRGLYYSFWGLFGWFNIPSPGIFYAWTALLLAAALPGAARCARRSHPTRDDVIIAALLVIFSALILVGWWHFNRMVLAGQGRLWFPLLGPLACYLGAGLSGLRPRLLPVLLLAGLGAGAVGLPFTRIYPAYAPQPQLAAGEWQPPSDALPVAFREPWQDASCLVAWIMPPRTTPDDVLQLSVAWEMQCHFTGYWSVFLHISDLTLESCRAGDTRHILRQYDTMPDGGNTPFPALLPGHVLVDTMTVSLPADLESLDNAALQLGLYDAGGTFIRAFVTVASEPAASPGTQQHTIAAGRCSPELVVVSLPSS